jgi:hypothetical protein
MIFEKTDDLFGVGAVAGGKNCNLCFQFFSSWVI